MSVGIGIGANTAIFSLVSAIDAAAHTLDPDVVVMDSDPLERHLLERHLTV
ncbi:MAG: hypothetical protein IT360_27230 [Gemmatimonadaceae bacterium]|nr:hypothetical protein [Gemmatimonadaceae bacterium]